MKKVLLPFLALILTITSAVAQDVGITKLIYPNTSFPVHELNSYVPVYWEFGNLGEDTIENRIVTLTLKADGSSLKFTEFRADMEVGFTVPVDPRKNEFYTAGLSNLFGIDGVMGLITPEAAPGDTIEVCLTASVTGDTDPTNNSLCFDIVLEERANRDLVLHILNPTKGTEINPNTTVDFDLSVRNDGSVAYKKDSVFTQMAIEKDGETLDIINLGKDIPNSIQPGDSAVVTFSIPLAQSFPIGDVFFGFRVSWVSEDGVYELGETNTSNNIRYVALKGTSSSINDIDVLNINAFTMPGQLFVNGDFNNENFNIELYDLKGSKVITSKSLQNTMTFNTSGLMNGMYVLVVQQEGKLVYREKVVLK